MSVLKREWSLDTNGQADRGGLSPALVITPVCR
jgi:hypothetical protein